MSDESRRRGLVVPAGHSAAQARASSWTAAIGFGEPSTDGDRSGWAPEDIDLERPSVSRIYDYLLGGAHNFAADRELAEQVLSIEPQAGRYARVNRDFLRRAVGFLIGEGARQFLDIGSGIPTVGNVHTVARRVAPDARVVYVDVDPVAVAHSRALLAGNDHADAVQADVRYPRQILDHPTVARLIDFGEPVTVLMVALLHFVADADDPAGIVAQIRDRLAPGSFLVVSHASPPTTTGDDAAARAAKVQDAYRRAATLTLRSRDEIRALFAGFALVEPGVVEVGRWRPEPANEPGAPVPGFAGIGVLR